MVKKTKFTFSAVSYLNSAVSYLNIVEFGYKGCLLDNKYLKKALKF